jgi:hypothetical protein
LKEKDSGKERRKEKRRKIIAHSSMFCKPKSPILGLKVGWEFLGCWV